MPYMQPKSSVEEAKRVISVLEVWYDTYILRNRGAERSRRGFGSQTWVSVQPPLLTRCVILVMALNLTQPGFLQLKEQFSYRCTMRVRDLAHKTLWIMPIAKVSWCNIISSISVTTSTSVSINVSISILQPLLHPK